MLILFYGANAAVISLLFAISAVACFFASPVVGLTIFIALFGGWIWQTLGIELLFVVSALLGLCNSAYAATIKPKRMA